MKKKFEKYHASIRLFFLAVSMILSYNSISANGYTIRCSYTLYNNSGKPTSEFPTRFSSVIQTADGKEYTLFDCRHSSASSGCYDHMNSFSVNFPNSAPMANIVLNIYTNDVFQRQIGLIGAGGVGGLMGSTGFADTDTHGEGNSLKGQFNVGGVEYVLEMDYTYYADLSDIIDISKITTYELPPSDRITIPIKDDSFPGDVYKWQISVDGGLTWHTSFGAPSEFREFSLSSLFYYAGLNINNYIGETFLIRLNPWGSLADVNHQQGVSNTVQYKIVRSAPDITITNPTGPKCAGTSDGSININLVDHILEENETLYLESDDNLFHLGIKPKDINATLSYICQIPTGTYNLTYYSHFTTSGTPGYSNSTPRYIKSIVIPEAPPSVTFTAKPDSSSCNNDGTITLSDITGGSGSGYQYYDTKTSAWKSLLNVTPPQITGLSAGDYNLRVKDGNGCESQPKTVTVGQIVPVTASITYNPDIACYGGTSSITLDVLNGTPPYNYRLDGAASATLPQNNIINGLSAGNHSVIIYDFNKCPSENLEFTTSGPADSLSIKDTLISHVTCNGKDNGSISVTAVGGTPNYTYTWKNEAGTTISTTSVAPNLTAGTYRLILTDGNYSASSPNSGCVFNKSFTIKQPDSLVVSNIDKKPNSCNGDSNGKIGITVKGGLPINKPEYTYQWYKKNISGDFDLLQGCVDSLISGRARGTYKVIVKDNKTGTIHNSIEDTIDLSDPSAISISSTSIKNVSCTGSSTGEITVNAIGGTGTLSYNWANRADTTKTITNLPAGYYTVTIKDEKLCSIVVDSIHVSEPDSIVATVSKKDPSCDGAELSSITLQATGGSGSYNYTVLKDGGSYKSGSFKAMLDISNPPEGTYSVALTDSMGCPVKTWNGVADHNSFQIIKPKPITIESTDISEIKCYGDVNGAITVHAKGGVGTLNYNWSGDRVAENTNTITGLGAGTYTVTISDTTTCHFDQTYILKSKYTKINLTFDKTDISCSNSSDGFAKVTATGGKPGILIPYTYQWDTGATTNTISNMGTKRHYKVTVTDSIGCSTTDSVYLYKPDPLTVTLKTYNPNGFDKGNGSITAEVKGGTADYSYDWSGKDFTGTDFKSTATSVSGLKAGNYSLTVTDKNGCTATASVSLTQPDPLIVNMTVTHPVSCHGDSDGSLKATASGGVKLTGETYKYTLKKINTDNTETIVSTGTSDCLSMSGSAGDYKVEVEDTYKNKLKSGNTITLDDATPLVFSTRSITDVNCYDGYTGEIHFTTTGGTGSYTYWNDKGETISNDLTGLHAGKYTVKIKDANGCELDHEFIVSEPSAALLVTLARKELSAYHATDAELVATVSGGTFSPEKPCSFDWTGSDSKTETASGLASGAYKLKVTDNNGCEAEAPAIFIDPLKVNIVVKHSIDCYGEKGELAARAVGGEPSLTGLLYKYTWYKHDIKTGVSTLLFPPVREDQSNDSLATNLPKGYYSVEIDDRHGRILQTAPFHLMQPEMVQISVDSTNVSCKGDNNGSIRVTASGGNGGYTYLWEDGSTQNERTNLPPGKYTVQVFDRKGCQPIPASRTITITEPDKLTLGLLKTDVLVSCDGKIEAIVAGGTRPYRFRWNDGEETVDSVKTLLCDGNYKVEVIDKNLCTATASILLPPPLKVKISVQDSVKCFGDNNGSLIVYAQGGVPYKIGKPYKYSWKKQNASGMYEELTVEKDSVAGLTAGWYALNITDSIGVTLRADSVFYLSQPEALAIRIQKTDVLCYGASTGAISAVVTGGLKPYTLKWSNDSTTADLNSLKAGVYILTATDRHGCTIQHSVSIEQHDSLMIGFTNIIAPTTSTACNGSLTASVSGGVRPYTYHWSVTNATTATADHLCYGTFYTVTVTDSVGCSAQVTKTSKFAPPPFVVSISVQDSIQCHGTAVGAIAAKVSGGIPFTTGKPYIYFWKKKNSTGEYHSIANSNDSTITQLTSGWYAFSVQDAELNISTESVEIYLPEPDALALTVSQKNITCNGLHNGEASVNVVGGVPPYTYKWSNNGETSPSIDNLAPGDYSIEVTDKHSCISRQSVTIAEPGLLSVSFQPKLISEYNVCDGSLKTVVRGGTAPFSYAWSGVNSTADAVSSLCAGEYSVTVTDAHGCSANQKTTFSNPPALRLSLVVQDSIKCNGNVQGVLVATAQGGIPFASGKKYRYTWKKKNSRGVFETMPAYTDSVAVDLATGTYACTITDANGISLHQDSVILLPEPTELQLVVQQTNIGCSGADEGSATVIPSGGSLPYSYAWSTGDKTATVRNLSAGSYIVRVTDRNGCVAARQMYISKAAPLYLFLYKKQPLCYQSCDGEIKTSVSGGIAPYSFQWIGSTSTGSEAGSLCAGKYSLLVTDAAGCTIQKTDSLQHPAQLPLQLGSNRYICSGQTIRYNINIPSKPGITYRWAGPDGFTATTSTVDLTKPGTYTASVTDAAGCSNSGSVTLIPSGTTVSNEFALPTQAFVNEKIVIVNTTYPAPDSIRWVLPAKAQLLSGGQSYAEFLVADTGAYVIKMISYKGVCSLEQEKEMIVSTRSQLSDIGNAKTPFIQAFSATPNPSHGAFEAKVVLQEKADIQLKLINILSSQTAYQIKKTGESIYELPINISVLKGTYLLLLETPKGSSTMKVIIF